MWAWHFYERKKPVRVRRSELTCPGNSMKMMTKAAESDADWVMFDLEDTVPPAEKEKARELVVSAFNTLDFKGKVRAFRPNNLRTQYWYEDITYVVSRAGHNIDIIVLPKIYGPEEIATVDQLLTQLERKLGLEPGKIGLEVLIETAQALVRLKEICEVSPRLEALIFGVADFSASIGAREMKRDQHINFLYAKQAVVVHAKAYGLDAIDCVTLDFKDAETTRKDAEWAARFGFDGKWVIHPSQIDIVNEVFTPSDEDIKRSLRIIEEYRKVEKEKGAWALAIDGEMVDAATIRVEFKKLLYAKKAGKLKELDIPKDIFEGVEFEVSH
ncbi:L-malyl-CoA/beta-methylmalyl-CoA lyase [bacterium HR19]|nr:L-malyl-CoA/beta-methylmalyl-CoA lyase [bacterium HR19]